MPYDPMDAARRKHRRQQRLGRDAVCVTCGEQNGDKLTRISRSLLERHHVLGASHDAELTIVVCLNCHARFSAAQQDDGVPLTSEANLLERGIAIMSAAGSSLKVMGDAFLEWSERGRKIVHGLDQDFREWRNRPWSRP